jgi:predicted TIM-barrel fold metal-dependent hydrolase
METDRIAIVSADCHAGPDRMSDYRPYLDPAHRAAYDDYLALIDAYEATSPSGLTRGGAGAVGGEEGLWDMAVRERCLDADGICAEVIYAQGSIPFGRYPAVGGAAAVEFRAAPDQLAAGCRAYNRWLADFCAGDPGRHLGIARIPLPDVEAAVAEVRFAREAGLRGGVFLPPLSQGDMPLYNDPCYAPLWTACADLQAPLNMHGGANLSYGGGPEAYALVLAETDWFSRRGAAHLVFSGVFERHPGLHLAITEQRAHWIAPLLAEWDSIYLSIRNEELRRRLPRRPSDYFRSNVFVGASFMSRPECDGRGALGPEVMMWGSDYPHGEGTWPYTDAALRWTFGGEVPGGELRAMLGGNAARCYHLDLAALQPVADRIGPTEAQLRTPVERLPGRGPGEQPVRSWAFRDAGPWH